ncbi:kinase-like domain-containing protein, partial [Amylocarpus encephaloides]
LLACGTTANIWRHPTRARVVIKAPVACSWESSESGELQKKFSNETQILEILGEHRNIVRYLGLLDPSKPARDLLFEEAINGDLQQYLNTYGDITDNRQKLLWCENAAEGLSYCHKLGVRHCDLRPDNLLVDEDLNIRICDFGGSTCGELDGGGLPDFGYFDPRDEDVFSVSESMEVFGLGSIMYSIMTGHRPHGPSVFKSSESIVAYLIAKFLIQAFTLGPMSV